MWEKLTYIRIYHGGIPPPPPNPTEPHHPKLNYDQGCKARKVISEVYTSLVLKCTVSGR